MEEALVEVFARWLREDSQFWDVTTSALVPRNARARAAVVAKDSGVVACLEEARAILEKLGFRVDKCLEDGATVERGETVIELEGSARKMLLIERTLLNLLMHCSGVATLAKKYVDLAKSLNPRVRVAITRKTLPGLRYFEKKAAWIAGCDTHRFSLDDAVLIKDNHVRIVGSVAEAVRLAKSRSSFTKKVEVEVRSAEEAVEAAEAGADIVMLDNFEPEEVERAIRLLSERGLRDRVLVEVSGGISLENISEYLKRDVDIVSVGSITHSAPALDMSLEVLEVIE